MILINMSYFLLNTLISGLNIACTTALLKITDDILRSIDRKENVV